MYCHPAIILQRQPYGDRGMLLWAYSAEHGYIALLTPCARGKNSGLRLQALLHPLAITTIRYTLPRNPDALGRLIDIEQSEPLCVLTSQTTRCAIALVISEMLQKILHGRAATPELFDFLTNTIRLLNNPDAPTALFPQIFALQLAQLLGYAPQGEYSTDTPYFDLETGTFCNHASQGKTSIAPPLARAISTICSQGYYTQPHTCPHTERAELMRKILLYLQIHSGTDMELKSLEILTQLFQ